MKGQGQSADSEETGADMDKFCPELSILADPLPKEWRAAHGQHKIGNSSGNTMPKATSPAPDLPATYELALQELETLVSRLDSGQVPLDQLLAGYQRGTTLLEFCRGRLQAVEDQIRQLDAAGTKGATGG